MRPGMNLPFFTIWIFMILFLATPCRAALKVVVLPFEVTAPQKMQYLKEEIPRLLVKRLGGQGASVFFLPDAVPKDKGLAGIRKIGLEEGADRVVWGSFALIGRGFSIDAKILETFSDSLPETVFVQGEGIENLLGNIDKLAASMSLKLFKWERVAQVRIEGNNRIEEDAIKRRIKTKVGDVLVAGRLAEDLKALWKMGYFEDIRIESSSTPQGRVITFKVVEKPVVRYIRFSGNRVFDDEELGKSISLKTGAILNIFLAQKSLERIESMYREKNYHNVKVTYRIEPAKKNQADLVFKIEEGNKVKIKEIRFIGNKAYSVKKLKKIMSTSEKGFFSWLTGSGELKREQLEQDKAKIEAFYQNNGFVKARVSDPEIEINRDWITITIKIDEGDRYEIGKISIEGDLIADEKELLEKLKISGQKYYNREMVRKDLLTLADFYAEKGYAYADIRPRIHEDPGTKKADIIYQIDKGPEVYFEKIIITGNVKTRDKVIRRELGLKELDLYNGQELKRGMRKLRRLDYFDDVQLDTRKGSRDDLMVLHLDVKEKPTGAFSFGGGYSSVDDVFVVGSVSQRNLFGRGQILELKAELGGASTRYTLSFTEPWLFDMPLSAGFDLYNWTRDYNTYDRDTLGGGIRLGYRIFDFTRVYGGYSYDISNIKNVTTDASQAIIDLEGENTTSKISLGIRYDSRDHIFNPTSGSDHDLVIHYAGLGGNIGFTKAILSTGWYIPMFKDLVAFGHGRFGYVAETSGKKLPDYERFYLGGINTLRGFDWRGVHALDENGDEVGGHKMVQFNFELLYPLFKDAGVVGLVFFDTGNVFLENEDLDLGTLRKSAGFGFRWYSPLGPMRLENGYIIDPKEGEDSGGRWEFTLGAAF